MMIYRLSLALLIVGSLNLDAAKPPVNFVNESITSVTQKVGKKLGIKFVVDPSVKGTVTILSPTELTNEQLLEGFALALATNNYAITEHGDFKKIIPSHLAVKDSTEVVNELPTKGYERMVTWIVKLKYRNAKDVFGTLGQTVLVSRNGEIRPLEDINGLVFTDWLSNLRRVEKVIAQLDIPVKK